MTQPTIDKIVLGIKIFGGVFAVIAISLLVWSMTRPPVVSPHEPTILEQHK